MGFNFWINGLLISTEKRKWVPFSGAGLPGGSRASAGGSRVWKRWAKAAGICSTGWVSSTAGGLQEHLSCLVWDVRLSWAKVLSPAFQQLPRKCSCFYHDGRCSFSCIPARPGTERASWGWQECGAGTSTAGKSCLEVETFPGPSLGIRHLYLGPSACPSYRISRQSGKFWQVTSLYYGSWQDFDVNWRDYRVKNWSCDKLKVEK